MFYRLAANLLFYHISIILNNLQFVKQIVQLSEQFAEIFVSCSVELDCEKHHQEILLEAGVEEFLDVVPTPSIVKATVGEFVEFKVGETTVGLFCGLSGVFFDFV